MTYQAELEDTAEHTARQVLAAVAMYEAGKLSAEAVAGIVAAFIAAGNLTAAALADLSLSSVLTMKLGRIVTPLGITRPLDEPDRLHKAASTLLSLDDPTPERWQRLAVAEAKTAAAQSYSEAIKRSGHVTGWTRGLSANACELCRWWSRDGRIWPDDHPMPTHKGCTCNPQPVTN